MLTVDRVMKAFDDFGDQSVHQVALQSRLMSAGYDVDTVAQAVSDAILSGHLKMSGTGMLSRP